jgi:hypothetical protein
MVSNCYIQQDPMMQAPLGDRIVLLASLEEPGTSSPSFDNAMDK